MLWKLFQLTVFLAVGFTGIYYEWTPNGLVLSLVAGFCAFGATVLLGDLFRLLRWLGKKLRPILREQGSQDRLTRWW
jgi:hypothetical protein